MLPLSADDVILVAHLNDKFTLEGVKHQFMAWGDEPGELDTRGLRSRTFAISRNNHPIPSTAILGAIHEFDHRVERGAAVAYALELRSRVALPGEHVTLSHGVVEREHVEGNALRAVVERSEDAGELPVIN